MIPEDNYQIEGIFPLPVYMAKRDSDLDSTEKKEVEDIIDEGMHDPTHEPRGGNWTSHNTYIFNNKLTKIKQFCEKHINIYVKEILNPKEEVNYYITQSWLNVTNPGEWHPHHTHANSIISGTFYISIEEGDTITWLDPNSKAKEPQSTPKEFNSWNTPEWSFTVNNNQLLLFPSWLDHYVPPNQSARSEPRMTIAFNTYAKGGFGTAFNRNELILQ